MEMLLTAIDGAMQQVEQAGTVSAGNGGTAGDGGDASATSNNNVSGGNADASATTGAGRDRRIQ